MVTVTDSAAKELGKLLSSADIADPGVSLRLVVDEPDQLSLMLDKEKEGDQVVEHEGSKVLLIGEEVAEVLHGVTLDCQETVEGPRLVWSVEGKDCSC